MGELNEHSGNRSAEPLQLAEKLDLRASIDLASALRDRRGGDLTVDGSAVHHLGAHAVQTLLVAVGSWSRDGHRLTCEPLSDPALQQLATLGVDPAQLSTGGAQ